MELNKEKTATVHNAKEDKGEEVIRLNVENKSGNKFTETKSIENVLCCNNITGNRKLRKGRNKIYADVISGGFDLSTEEVAFDMQNNNNEVDFVKSDDRKKDIDLNAILVNLTEEKMSFQHPTSPPKLCRDTSTSNNSSGCFNKQVRLDEDVDGEYYRYKMICPKRY